MSGIFGCWHRDGRALDAERLRSCLQGISPAALTSSLWHRGPIALAAKANGDTRRHSTDIDDRDVVCVCDGRLDNRDELLSALHDRWLHADSSDGDFVRAAYEASGDRFAERITGDFACALFDRRANRLLVARDRLGMRPLCFTEVDGTFLFASEAKALLNWPGVSAAPDDVMLADFVLQFVPLDAQNRTFFRDVQSLPPAHLLIVTPAGTVIRRYFDFNTEQRLQLPRFPDYVDAFHGLVTRAVKNRLRDSRPVAVSVSGGLDSSYIFAVASRLVRDGDAPCTGVLGFNYSGAPGSPGDEEVFVQALERESGLTIERIPQQAGFMRFAGEEVSHSESPLIEALAAQRQAMFARVRHAGAGRLLTGHWGDQMLFDTSYLVDLWWSGQWNLLRRHLRQWRLSRSKMAMRIGRDLLARFTPSAAMRRARRSQGRRAASCAPWYTERFRDLIRDRFEACRLTRTPGSSHAWAMYQQSRRTYHVQCMEWNSRVAGMHGLEMAFPYLDGDLVQFLMSIPGDMQSHDGVPRGLMRAAMRGRVPDLIVDRRTKGEFTRLANESIELDFSIIARLLGPSSLAVQFGYVDGPVLWSWLAEWRTAIRAAHTATVANRLIELCGMELLLRQFAAADSGEPGHRSTFSHRSDERLDLVTHGAAGSV